MPPVSVKVLALVICHFSCNVENMQANLQTYYVYTYYESLYCLFTLSFISDITTELLG